MSSQDDEERRGRSAALDSAAVQRERQRIERELREERERLRITLASIGDAVISTDAEGKVVFLNGVAEMLTGWSQADAIGRPLPEVFHIVNETTRRTVANPALRALAEGRVVDLANHTILIARDGTEWPIDDSAAPMKNDLGVAIGAVLVFRDVTERRRAAAAQAQLAAIVASSDDAIIGKTLDGVIESWNASAERIFGYSRDEAIGKHITILIPPDRFDEEESILDRLRRGERVEHFETVRLRKDGSPIDISLTVSPIKDGEGRVIGASKVSRDITARKRADEALRESEGRHRFLSELAAATQPLSGAAEMLAVTARLLAEHLDVDRCAYAEIEDESVFVITGDHPRGVPSIVGRWPVAAFGAECERLMLANQPYVVDDVDLDPRTGPDLTAYRQTAMRAVICVPLHKEGRFVAAMAVHQKAPRRWTAAELRLVQTVVARSWESLERTRVARGLVEAADRLALALEAAQLGDWSWDAASGRITLSPRAAQILGVPPDAGVDPAALRALLREEDRELAAATAARAVASRDPCEVELRVIRPGGTTVWISANGRAQVGASGEPTGVFGVVQDVTERKRLEEQLRQRLTELAESDRKKDDFIALLAHELRNPLAPIRTGLQVMRLAAGDANEVAKARTMMDRQLSHMVRLIDDLLDVSRMNRSKLHLQRERVLLAEVVSHAVEAASPSVEAAGHQLHVSLPPEPIVLHADLTRLAQVFGNLLANSVKYTERGGRIWLTAERRGGEVVVSVRDTGIGIPAEALPGVFDMFSQVDRTVERATGGLGIGLALVKGLVEAHGGQVSAESPPGGGGTTFTVRLPVVDRLPAPAGPVGQTGELRPVRRVLVADDNRDGAAMLADLLGLLGSEVVVAHDGLEAVEVAERTRPDLILMDVGMPRLDGLDAARRIRARPWGRRVTIVALTGWGQEGDRERSRAAGCDAHLVKPVSMEQLEKVLSALPQESLVPRP